MNTPEVQPPPQSFAAWLQEHALAVSAVIGAIAAGLTLWIQWDDWVATKNECVVAGSVYDRNTRQPFLGASVGWAADNDGRTTSLQFVKVAETGLDGGFRGECDGAHESLATDDRFELLVSGGNFQGGPLPCLGERHTGIRVRRTGTHEGLNLTASC